MNELRQFPRVHTQLEAELTNGEGETHLAIISNISPGGLMIHGDNAVKQHICEFEDRDPMQEPVEIHLRCKLPGEPQPFLCRCRLIYIRRLSQSEFDIGFRYIDMSEIHAGMLHRFIFQKDPKVIPLDTRRAGNAG